MMNRRIRDIIPRPLGILKPSEKRYTITYDKEDCQALPDAHIDHHWDEDRGVCVIREGPKGLNKLKADIYNLLYLDEGGHTPDRKLLTLIILRDLRGYFDFLRAGTEWESRGWWKEEPKEHNIIVEIEFTDTEDGRLGQTLLTLFEEYYYIVSDEELGEPEEALMANIVDVEETTLEWG